MDCVWNSRMNIGVIHVLTIKTPNQREREREREREKDIQKKNQVSVDEFE